MNDWSVPRVTAIGRPFVAALAAGTIFMLAVTVSMDRGRPVEALGLVLALSPVTTIVGFALAIVPCLLGCTLLHALGTGNVGARLPAFWALIGGLTAGGAAAAASPEPTATVAFAATGTACALICRSGARWT